MYTYIVLRYIDQIYAKEKKGENQTLNFKNLKIPGVIVFLKGTRLL